MATRQGQMEAASHVEYEKWAAAVAHLEGQVARQSDVLGAVQQQLRAMETTCQPVGTRAEHSNGWRMDDLK